jgi:hypothetical protein
MRAPFSPTGIIRGSFPVNGLDHPAPAFAGPPVSEARRAGVSESVCVRDSAPEDDRGKPATEWTTYKAARENGEVVESGPIHTDTYKYLKPAVGDAPAADRPPN